MQFVNINGRKVGDGAPCFIIAEAGVNHNGQLALARQLVDAAKTVGADAVKFQTFKAEQLVTADAPKAEYQKLGSDSAETQLEMLRKLELSAADHRDLLAYCRAQKIEFLSSPFDESSVDFLLGLGIPAFKIPSGEVTNLPLLAHVAKTNRPVIMSTGMSNLAEVETAVGCIADHGNPPLILLHCVSNYPAAPIDVNLRAMSTMAVAFKVPVGYSDHTEGNEATLAAVALGACVIEKHLTLSRNLPGPDHKASLEPHEFAAAVRGIRIVEEALGSGRKTPATSEAAIAAVARKSIVLARDVSAGSELAAECVAMRRPGTGLPAAMLPRVVGRRVRHAMRAGQMLQLTDLD